MNEVSLEKIVDLVVQEVVKELVKNGVKIVGAHANNFKISDHHNHDYGLRTKVEHIDMSNYKTPLLTERHIRKLHELTGEIIIPVGTIITPKAKEAIRTQKININYQ